MSAPVLVVPDSFKGTLAATEVAAAVARGLRSAAREAVELPVADGGEGTMDVLQDALGGERLTVSVGDPLGRPVEAAFVLLGDGATAVVEAAQASGLGLVADEERDAFAASSKGTGELIVAAAAAGADTVLVTVGGSATTDGGAGALAALGPRGRLAGVEVVVACDVDTLFVDAAELFAPQKGATPAQVALLRRRLERLAQIYVRDYGVDVRDELGSGAAGGLAGGLAAAGALLVPGFDVVAEALSLVERIAAADLVVTGEGTLDAESFEGKAVGGVVDLAVTAGVPVLVVTGQVLVGEIPVLPPSVEVVSLVARFGLERARSDVAGCVEEVVSNSLRRCSP